MRPSLMTTTRSDSERASSWSWVTYTVVMPSCRWIARISWRRTIRIFASSAESGSSSSSTCGSNARARASATRCCWPPESCHGYRSPRPSRWGRSSSSVTRLPMSAFGRLRTRSPKPMLSATVMFGKSAYDWKTMPTLRWFGGTHVMSRPSIVISPAVGFSKPAIIRSVVVLPQPEGPRNDTNSPFSTARLKSMTAAVSPKYFWTPVSSRNAMRLLAALAGAGDGDLAARAAPEQGDEAHRDPRQAEADERDGGLLVGLVAAEDVEVRGEGRPCQVVGHRELAHDDRQGEERAA